MRVGQNAISTTDLVAKHARFSLEQSLPCVVLLIDDRLNHFAQTIDDLFLLFTERSLIRNLKKIAHCFGAFAIKAAHSQTDFADRLNDLIDQLAQNESRQVQHRRGAHAGADVSGTGGLKTEPRERSKAQFTFPGGINFLKQPLSPLSHKARRKTLAPDEILFFTPDRAEYA